MIPEATETFGSTAASQVGSVTKAMMDARDSLDALELHSVNLLPQEGFVLHLMNTPMIECYYVMGTSLYGVACLKCAATKHGNGTPIFNIRVGDPIQFTLLHLKMCTGRRVREVVVTTLVDKNNCQWTGGMIKWVSWLGVVSFGCTRRGVRATTRFLELFLEGSLKDVFLRRVVRRRLVKVSIGQGFLEGLLEGGMS